MLKVSTHLSKKGRPVWPEYDDELMSADVQYDPQYPLQIGVDFGFDTGGYLWAANIWRLRGKFLMSL